jgi:hypothetical protein
VDYGACLENRCGFAPTVGSNPSPSACKFEGMEKQNNWGGARVVDRGRLLSGCWVLSPTEGSNPSLPAGLKDPRDARVYVLSWHHVGVRMKITES